MKSSTQLFVCIIVFIAAVTLGVSVLFTPAPREGADTEFSAYRAAGHIEEISKAPHTMNDQAELKRIRGYLKERLKALGCTVEFMPYTIEGYRVTNVFATMRGTSGTDALLLVAHYDSNPGEGVGEAPGSHGAADDAYGVSVILETLRAVRAMGEVKNTIYVLFTDGEETDMLGAKAAADDAGFPGLNAKAVMNIESRGMRGPAIMFETGRNNEELFGFYIRRAGASATWSLASDVYRIMPNYTDFTSFIGKGMQGLNFSNLDALCENHTPLDRYENISLSAIQGYGNQLLPVISGFAFEDLPDGFTAQGDATFFTPAYGISISYPASLNYILLILSVVAAAAYILLAVKAKSIKPSRLLFALAVVGLALAAAAAGGIITFLLSLIFGVPFKPTNMPQIPFQGGIAIIATALLGIVLFFIVRSLMKKGWRYEELTGGALAAFLVMQAVFTFALPGGTFLFSWGCLFGALFAIAALYLPKALRPFTGFAAVWIAAPVVALLHIALSVGALGAVMLFAAFPFMLFLPALAAATFPPQKAYCLCKE